MAKRFKIRMNSPALEALHAAIDPASAYTQCRVDEADGSVVIGTVRFANMSDLANVEAEAALCGALMIENRLVDDVAHLRAEHFYEPCHARLYDVIVAKVGKGEIANPVTLRRWADADEALSENLGGASYLAQLTGSGAAVIGARDFADQIIELANLRAGRGAMLRAISKCEDGTLETPLSEIVGELEAELADISTSQNIHASVAAGITARDVVKNIEKVGAGESPMGFLLKGFEDYNYVRGRMEGGEFDLLGARPGMGKTGISLAIARGAAEAGIGTEYLSFEMKKDKLTRRILADMIYRQGQSCTYQQLIEGRLSKEDWRSLVDATEHLETLPLSINDRMMTVEEIAPELRKRKRWFEKRGQPLQFVVIDYLGRLGSHRKFNSETELVGYISRTLKSVAQELDVTLLALAQLNRGLEQRENKRPMLADLRQSGSLEQDADNVIFLYRDEYYLEKIEPPRDKIEKWEKWADEIHQVRDDVEIYSSKRREGGLSKRIAKFFTRYQAVRDHGDYAAAPSFFDDDDAPERRG